MHEGNSGTATVVSSWECINIKASTGSKFLFSFSPSFAYSDRVCACNSPKVISKRLFHQRIEFSSNLSGLCIFASSRATTSIPIGEDREDRSPLQSEKSRPQPKSTPADLSVHEHEWNPFRFFRLNLRHVFLCECSAVISYRRILCIHPGDENYFVISTYFHLRVHFVLWIS